MILARRSFLTGLSSLIAAPAIVRASSLMPIKKIINPFKITEYDGPINSTPVDVLYGQMKIGDIVTFGNFTNEPWIIAGKINEVVQIKPMK